MNNCWFFVLCNSSWTVPTACAHTGWCHRVVPAKKQKNSSTYQRLQCCTWQYILDTCRCFTQFNHFTYLWWVYLFFMDISLPLEPAVFSVKTTPRTRNQKVTKPHLPAMSLTLQVTSTLIFRLILLFFSSHSPFHLFFVTYSSFSSCPYLCMHHCIWLPHTSSVCPSHTFFSLSLPLTHTNKLTLLKRLCWWRFARCTRHVVMVKGGVCIFPNVFYSLWKL